MTTHIPRAAALALPLVVFSLTPSFAAQQDLMILGRFNRMWVIEDLNTPQQAISELAPVQFASDSQDPLNTASAALCADRASNDMFILRSNWLGFEMHAPEIWRLDVATGATTVEHTFGYPEGETYGGFRGLAQRPDGRLVTIFRGEDFESSNGIGNTYLTVLDPANGVTTHTELSGSTEPLHAAFFMGFDLDQRGVPTALSQAGTLASSGAVTIDTVSGEVAQASLPGTPFTPWGMVQANNGDFYAGTPLGDFWRYDSSQSSWVEVFDQGGLTVNYLYGVALTNVDHGSDFEVVCDGAPNSTGEASTLEFLGVSDVANNDLTLIARGLPTATTGFFLMGATEGAIPAGSGILCIQSPVFRDLSSLSVADGPVAHPLDLNSLPSGQPAMAGTRQIFQYWHRDHPAGQPPTSNFSAAVAVDFQ